MNVYAHFVYVLSSSQCLNRQNNSSGIIKIKCDMSKCLSIALYFAYSLSQFQYSILFANMPFKTSTI